MINERIIKIRKEAGLTQTAFAEILGVTRSVISNLEYNKVEAKPLLLNHLANVFNINKIWLETGEGDMYLLSSEEIKRSDLLIKVKNANPAIAEIIEKTLLLNEENQQLILAMVSALVKSKY